MKNNNPVCKQMVNKEIHSSGAQPAHGMEVRARGALSHPSRCVSLLQITSPPLGPGADGAEGADNIAICCYLPVLFPSPQKPLLGRGPCKYPRGESSPNELAGSRLYGCEPEGWRCTNVSLGWSRSGRPAIRV